MGTNYYLVDKKKFEKEKELSELLNKTFNESKLEEQLMFVLLSNYKAILDQFKDDEDEYQNVLESFKEELAKSINNLMSDLKYNINYLFNVSESTSKHIGKSSIGWLFNFQYQDEWHSYDEFRSFILDKEKMKDKIIIDEYNKEISPEELLDWIDTKQKDKHNLDNPDNFKYSDNVNGYRFSSGDFS